MEELIALCKRRGFIYPSSDIYGGLANTWDFGHYGTLLKNNLRDLWWKKFVLSRDDMVGVDASIFLNPKVWEASGHVSGFTDALVDCKNCKYRTRADHLIEDYYEREKKVRQKNEKLGVASSYAVNINSRDEIISSFDSKKDLSKKVEGSSPEELTAIIKSHPDMRCPHCGKYDWTPVRKFNLLFETHLGIVEESKSKVYLRGEIAQGIFLNFKNVLQTMRVRIPFGIAQQGKAFRNEITMGQAIFRTLEFDLMEFEYFIHKNHWEELYEYWREEMWKFAQGIGLDEKNLRWREHEEFERSHYSKRTMDIEYNFPFGWKEMWGIAYRTDFDLANHAKHSGKDLSYTDPKTGESFIPHVIEPTFGLSRLVLVLLHNAYREEEVNGKMRTFLKIKPAIAPIKVAVFPLQKDEKLRATAKNIYQLLKSNYTAEFDDAGNIGKMYRRQDEIGTPFCITIDYQTLEDNTVTIRDRDTMKQQRINVNELNNLLQQQLL